MTTFNSSDWSAPPPWWSAPPAEQEVPMPKHRLYKFNPQKIFWRINDYRLFEILSWDKVIGKTVHGTAWLAGGVFRGLLDKQDEIMDFDMFFSNTYRSAEVAVELEERGFECIFKCPKGELTTYKKVLSPPETSKLEPRRHGSDTMKVQLITKQVYQTTDYLLASFDVNPCRFAYDGEFLYTDRDALRSVRKRELSLNNCTHPNATFKRIMKYKDKGYKVTNECIDQFVNAVYDMGINHEPLNRQFYVD